MVIHDDWMMIWGTMTLETTKNLSYFWLVVSFFLFVHNIWDNPSH